jgi:hypothetical protein
MAWTEVCKLNFEHACTVLIKKNSWTANKAHKKLSEESGIPAATLRRWWVEITKEKLKKISEQAQEEELFKNEQLQQPADNANDSIQDNSDSVPKEDEPEKTEEKPFVCLGCGRSEPEVKCALNGSDEPYGKKSKFFGMCVSCKRKAQKAANVKPDEGLRVVCPHCAKSHYLKWTAIYRAVDNKRRDDNG